MTSVYVPAFEMTKDFLKEFGKNKLLQSLILESAQLNEEEMATRIKEILKEAADKVSLEKMEHFLYRMGQLMENSNPGWVEELRLLQASTEMNFSNKKEAFKKLLLDNQLIHFIAACIRNYRNLQRTPADYFHQVNQKNLEVTRAEFKQRAGQSIYGELEDFLIRSTLRLLFQFCDLALLEAGMKPVFTPLDEENAHSDPQNVRFIPMKMG